MDSLRLAWAAGFFEAEGSVTHHLPTGRKTCRPTIDVSQKGDGTVPRVLVRFQEIFDVGQIFGPYRGYLYYWRTHDTAAVASTLLQLWSWLSPEKRAQAQKTLSAVPALWCTEVCGEMLGEVLIAGQDERRAWAAGFFEGDGTIGAYDKRRGSAAKSQLSASIAQASTGGIPTSLQRFHEIVRAGTLCGPIDPQGWSRLPQYRWVAGGQTVITALAPLLPWIVGSKRLQIEAALATVRH